MSKICQIEISDFRVYEGKQVFSFEQGGKPANLVVIYAPNGYGKTSFFDAVEWSFSGKIGRFERENIAEEVQRRDFANGDQILLTNRKSFTKGREGQITMVTDNGKTVQRRVDSRKINGRTGKYDYRQGVYSGTLKEAHLAKLCSNNLLTQDQIDSFLKFTTPEEKFTALSQIWSEGESATRTYKQLSSYLRMIEGELKAAQDRLGLIKKSIKALLNADQHLQTINTRIVDLKKDSVLGFTAELLAHPVDEAVYQSLREAALSFLKRGEFQLEQHIRSRTGLQDLMARFPAYAQASKDLPIRQKEQAALLALEKLYLDLRSATKAEAERQESLAGGMARLGQITELLGLLDTYLAEQRELGLLQRQQQDLLYDSKRDLAKMTVYRESYRVLHTLLRQREDERAELRENINSLLEKHQQFLYWRDTSETDQKKIKETDRLLAEKQVQIDGFLKRRREVTQLLESADYSELLDADVLALGKHLTTYRELQRRYEQNSHELEQVKKDYQHSGSLEENLDRLLAWGAEYVQALDENHCPLCKTEFANVSDLLDQIRSEKRVALKVQDQERKIWDLEDKQKKLSGSQQEVKAHVEAYWRSVLQTVNVLLESAQREKDDLTTQQRELKQSQLYAGDMAQSLYKELSPYLNDAAEKGVPQVGLDELLDARLELLTKRTERLAAVVAGKKELMEQTENRVSVNRNRSAGLDNSMALFRASASSVSCERLAAELGLQVSMLSKENSENLQKETQDKINGLRRELAALKAQLNELNGKMAKIKERLREEEIAGRKFELTTVISSLEGLINSYAALHDNHIVNEDDGIELTTLENALKYTIDQIALIEAETVRLRDFTIQIELINENINKARLKGEQADINKTLPRLERAKARLDAARNAAAEYIDREISNYFNQELINQIYSRIEPHPELNRIEFTPQIRDQGPGLDVYAVGENDHLNPVLFLSAGQLNVLSLSIFLAKVFETGSEVISTIFMDDPVQNLSDINILSFLDLIRSMITTYDKQLVISSHDEHFFRLMQNKLPAEDFNARYIELADFGQIKASGG
jgi:exonuclease SbcC